MDNFHNFQMDNNNHNIYNTQFCLTTQSVVSIIAGELVAMSQVFLEGKISN